MSKSYKCPYCHEVCYNNGNIEKIVYESFEHSGVCEAYNKPGAVVLILRRCHSCGKISVEFFPCSNKGELKFHFAYPPENAIYLPDYIPAAIRSDYLEAISIVDLSPKASATLARRCLQGMIHDFWGIKEKNLNAEITSLNGKVPASQWKAIDALRKIGNIGAHMEKDVELIIDVDPGEAKKLLKLIELLIQKWYVARHDEEELFTEITTMAAEKEDERRAGSSVNTNSQ